MKFLCLACDEGMRLLATSGPDEGSLTVTFACPGCGHRVAMLTNPWETQLVRTLGVKVGGAAVDSVPALRKQLRTGIVRGAATVEARRGNESVTLTVRLDLEPTKP